MGAYAADRIGARTFERRPRLWSRPVLRTRRAAAGGPSASASISIAAASQGLGARGSTTGGGVCGSDLPGGIAAATAATTAAAAAQGAELVRTGEEAVVGWAVEVTDTLHRAIILALWTQQCHAHPYALAKGRFAEEAHNALVTKLCNDASTDL